MTAVQNKASTFAILVDKLRNMDEAELKMAYTKLFADEINEEWREITSQMTFGEITDEEITAAVMKLRYLNKA